MSIYIIFGDCRLVQAAICRLFQHRNSRCFFTRLTLQNNISRNSSNFRACRQKRPDAVWKAWQSVGINGRRSLKGQRRGPGNLLSAVGWITMHQRRSWPGDQLGYPSSVGRDTGRTDVLAFNNLFHAWASVALGRFKLRLRRRRTVDSETARRYGSSSVACCVTPWENY